MFNLGELKKIGSVKNPLITKSLESELPEGVKKEWLIHGSKRKPEDRFDIILKFLRSQVKIYEQLD